MIREITTGNILDANAEALVNTVNCVGVMGKGLALQFKKSYPENFKDYVRACKTNVLVPGKLHIFKQDNSKYIINFPTKNHWKEKSKIEYIENGLSTLKNELKKLEIKSIAIPPLGCGNGGLYWPDVRKLIYDAFQNETKINILLYSPQYIDGPRTMKVKLSPPKMTKNRALFILLIKQYKEVDYGLTAIEIQKIAYFLQESGEKLNLNFEKHLYGPFSSKIRHVLNDMEGHYLQGFGDNTGRSEITICSDVDRKAEELLNNDAEALDKLERVQNLITGFETPYGMELLATIHWLVNHENIRTLDEIPRGLESWSDKKKNKFKSNHIESAWNHLKALNWI